VTDARAEGPVAAAMSHEYADYARLFGPPEPEAHSSREAATRNALAALASDAAYERLFGTGVGFQ